MLLFFLNEMKSVESLRKENIEIEFELNHLMRDLEEDLEFLEKKTLSFLGFWSHETFHSSGNVWVL